jgi:hypothetical protein
MTFSYVEREYDTYIFLCELNPKSFRIFPSYIRWMIIKKKNISDTPTLNEAHLPGRKHQLNNPLPAPPS